MERTHHSGLMETASNRRGTRRKATPLAGQAASPKKSPFHGESYDGFLALLGNHGDLAPAVNYVKTASAESPWRKIVHLSIFRLAASSPPTRDRRDEGRRAAPRFF